MSTLTQVEVWSTRLEDTACRDAVHNLVKVTVKV
jgi:hypothetical protein